MIKSSHCIIRLFELTYSLPVLGYGKEGGQPGGVKQPHHQVPGRVEDEVPAGGGGVQVRGVGEEGEEVLPEHQGGEDTAGVDVEQSQDQARERVLARERFPP